LLSLVGQGLGSGRGSHYVGSTDQAVGLPQDARPMNVLLEARCIHDGAYDKVGQSGLQKGHRFGRSEANNSTIVGQPQAVAVGYVTLAKNDRHEKILLGRNGLAAGILAGRQVHADETAYHQVAPSLVQAFTPTHKVPASLGRTHRAMKIVVVVVVVVVVVETQ
jgi:hypothetical protein